MSKTNGDSAGKGASTDALSHMGKVGHSGTTPTPASSNTIAHSMQLVNSGFLTGSCSPGPQPFMPGQQLIAGFQSSQALRMFRSGLRHFGIRRDQPSLQIEQTRVNSSNLLRVILIRLIRMPDGQTIEVMAEQSAPALVHSLPDRRHGLL